MVCWSYAGQGSSGAVKWPSKERLQQHIRENDLLVFFNAKFDLQWFVKEGLEYDPTKIWDCQLAHFIMTNQTHRFPSLNEVAEYWGLPMKPDVVRTEYWEKGINTGAIPWPILSEYATHDARITYQIYLRQRMTKYQRSTNNSPQFIPVFLLILGLTIISLPFFMAELLGKMVKSMWASIKQDKRPDNQSTKMW